VAEQSFKPLPISAEHGRLGGLLSGQHRDPFDRILAAQALLEGLPLMTNDPAFPASGVTVVW
jgi:PIN domain nuclease of toxin-antitoxin system